MGSPADHESYFRAIRTESDERRLPRDAQGRVKPSAFGALCRKLALIEKWHAAGKADTVMHSPTSKALRLEANSRRREPANVVHLHR